MCRSIVIGVLAVILFPASASAQNCEPTSVAVQILGSGGPRINPFRSSTSYLLWVDDQARVLVDMGGGALSRFGQAQAKISHLSLLAVSHLHPDHISDLPAFLWQSHLERKEPLPIVGPSGNDAAPDFSTFLSRLFDENNGAFPVLGATLGGKRRDIPSGFFSTGGSVRLDVGVIDVTKITLPNGKAMIREFKTGDVFWSEAQTHVRRSALSPVGISRWRPIRPRLTIQVLERVPHAGLLGLHVKATRAQNALSVVRCFSTA